MNCTSDQSSAHEFITLLAEEWLAYPQSLRAHSLGWWLNSMDFSPGLRIAIVLKLSEWILQRRLRDAERAVNLPFDAKSSIRLDAALLAYETIRETLS